MDKIDGEHKDNVFLLSSPGIARMVVLRVVHHGFCVYMRLSVTLKFQLIMLLV